MRTVDIKGYEGLYQITDTGVVIGMERKTSGGVSLKRTEKALKLHPKGYHFVRLCKNSIIVSHFVHRLVAEAFIPNPHGYPQINHLQGNKQDNRAEMLEWCNQSMNMKHSVHVLGNKPFGGENYRVCRYKRQG